MDFSEKLQSYEDFICGKNGASAEQVLKAEKQLGLLFAKEYKSYTEKFGIAAADGHEFTGVGEWQRLGVVQVTENERKKNPYIPDNLYVIERLDIDDIVIWQDQHGCVFQTVYEGKPEKIAQNLMEYLDE